MIERRRVAGRPVPRRVVRASAACRAPVPEVRRGVRGRQRDRGLDDDGLRPAAAQPAPRSRCSASASCRSSPTRPARSAWIPLFKEVGIYAARGQRYEPVDSKLLLSYREATDGQVLEEGITEAGSMAPSRPRARPTRPTASPMIPFYIFYSMFGFQRTGDQVWAFGDARGRGLPARRHRRPHHAQRRGPAARGRPQPCARVRGADRPRLRPGVRVRARGDRARRHRPDVRPGRGRLLLRHALQRELPACRPSPRASDEGIVRGLYRFRAGARAARGEAAASGWWARARSCSRSCAPRSSSPSGTGSRPTCSAPRHQLLRARRSRWSAGTGCTPTQAPRVPHVARSWAREGGPVVVVDGLDQDRARPRRTVDPRHRSGAGHGRLRPERHARGAAAHFEIDARASPRRPFQGSPGPGPGTPARRRPRSVSSASIPTAGTRCSPDTPGDAAGRQDKGALALGIKAP